MHPSTATVILAGGLGSRIGGDKALQRLQGKPLLDWVLDVVRPQISSRRSPSAASLGSTQLTRAMAAIWLPTEYPAMPARWRGCRRRCRKPLMSGLPVSRVMCRFCRTI